MSILNNFSVPEFRRRLAGTSLLLVAAMLLVAGMAWAQPSQSPLLSRSGGGVSPNVVLDLDDSGSMMYQHMPEGSFTLGGKSVNLGGDQSAVGHPLDTRNFSGNYRGVYTANTGATGSELTYQQLVRSPDVNSLYYNPETTYLPWAKNDGTRFPAAAPGAAQFNPMVPAVTSITFVAAATEATANSNNLTPALPTRAAGDLLICLAESFDLVEHTTASAGWTRIYNLQGSATHTASAFYKIAGASEANPVITHTGGSSIVARCFAYRGVDTTQPFDVAYAASAAATSSTTNEDRINTGSLTTVTADTMILMTSHQANNPGSMNVTTAGGLGWTQAGGNIASFDGTNDVSVGLHHAVKASVGAIGPLQVRSNQDGRRTGVLLALRKGPSAAATSGGVNLLAPTSNFTTNWCMTATSACGSSSKSYTPMLFYRLKKNGSGVYLDPTDSANYDSYDLTNNLKNGSASAAPQTYSKRTDCTANVCSIEQERQNFANWYVYHRSRLLVAQSAIAESFWNIDETKLRVGWGSIHKDYTNIDGDQVATVISGVRKFTPARKDALFDFVRNIDVESGTPLRSALWGVGEYYTKASPWADDPGNLLFADPVGSGPKNCRRAYHLLITDGLWNTTGAPFSKSVGNFDGGAPSGDASAFATGYPTITSSGLEYKYDPKEPYSDSNSDTLADFASYFFNRDLRPTLDNNAQPTPPNKQFWQGMVNYTVGIGLKGTLDPATDLPALSNKTKSWGTDKVDDLWHAAVNSEGKFFSAKNSSELADALTSALTTTTQSELREAGVATASTVLEEGNRKYIPFYKSGAWTGDIRAFELDAGGLTKIGPGPNDELWSAESKLPAWNLRNIYTWNSSAGAPSLFTWADMGALNQGAIGPSAGSAELVNYLRGDATNEVTAAVPTNPYRARGSRLGDFINSNPVLVKRGVDLGYQTLTEGGSTYSTYRTDVKAVRPGVLFVGANDGMVHAFKDTQGLVSADDGKEIFAYVPRAVYSNLSKLSDQDYGSTTLYHQFFVDGAFSETDAYVKATPAATAASWRNYLVGSLGAGGRAVLAFDVTDMSSPGAGNIKWEFSQANDSDLGYVSAPIEVGVLPNGTWVAIFGNGPFSTDGKAVLFVLNLETGVANKLVVDALTPANGLGGVGVQRDASGYITNLFAGDLNGALWKFDYSAAATSKFVVSGAQAMFRATSPTSEVQPITQAPLVYDHALGGKLVVFATGKLLVDADRETTGVQSMYAVWDKPADTVGRPLTRSSLANRALSKVIGSSGSVFYALSGDAVNYSSLERGWVIDLLLMEGSTNLLAGQRVIYPPQKVSNRLALISTIAPAGQTAVCTAATGLGANYLIPVQEGLNPSYKLFDTNGDGFFTGADASVTGYATNVDGIDSVIKGLAPPAVPGDCQKISLQNTTGQVTACEEVEETPGGGATTIRDRTWRRILNPPIR